MTEVECATEAVRKQAMNMLARREHSCAELRVKLAAKGFAVDVIDATLNELQRAGWQSDERFVEAYIRVRCDRGYGPARIRAELKERGVSDELIADHLNARDGAWLQRLQAVLVKRYGRGRPADYAEQAKRMRFLQARGFTAEQIRRGMHINVDELESEI